MTNHTQQRSVGLDVVRAVAAMSVVAVHFSLNTQFYHTPIQDATMWWQEFLRCGFMTCVPLFMLLTGYLNGKKTPTIDYYKGVWKIIEAYLFYTVLAILFRIFYLHQSFNSMEWLEKIWRFNANEYGWYIEMYLGLFLLIPFLNILYQNIPTQREKQILIGSLLLMSVNTNMMFGFSLLPAYWTIIYPLAFYFLGSYIKEFQPEIAWQKGLAMLFFLLVLAASLAFFKGKSVVFFYFNSPIVVVAATIIFLLLYKKDFQNSVLRWFFSKTSLLSLDIYLCSYIFDQIFYPYFKNKYFISQQQFFIFLPLLFLVVFTSSFLVAWVRETVKNLFQSEKN